MNRARSVLETARTISEAARAGARLIAFPETHIPGYPVWIWRLSPAASRAAGPVASLHRILVREAVDLSSDDLDPVLAACRREKVTAVLGIQERERSKGFGTLYNTFVVVGSDGVLRSRHRKLIPTNVERTVWGPGDASGLRVVPTDVGRLGGLICWENYMPLARYALYSEAPEIYLALTTDEGEGWLTTVRHIAREARCWVLNCGTALRGRDLPVSLPGRDGFAPAPDEWLYHGDSAVISPDGSLVAGPLHDAHGILYASVDLTEAAVSRRTLDVVGHYARPDLFSLSVQRHPAPPVRFDT